MTTAATLETLRARGLAALQDGRLADSIDDLQRALALAPGDAQANLAFANLCIRLQQPELAVEHLQRVLAAVPGSEAARCGMAHALCALGRAADGLALLADVQAHNPRSRVAWMASGIIRERMRDDDGARRDYEAALALAPGDSAIRYHRAFLRLRAGDFAAGWADYEHRFGAGAVARPARRARRWDGAAVAALDIVAEQGLGDAIHFARFVAAARERARSVTLRVAAPLVGLLARSLDCRVIALDDPGGRERPAASIEMMSLPHALGLGDRCVEAPAAYLRADPRRADALAALLPRHAVPSVGVAWAASSAHATEATPYSRRSVPAPLLRGLAELPGWRAVSLQVGPRARDAAALPGVLDAAPLLKDFDDTAALVAQLDAVVTVDTSIAHLAGALGKPVLLLAPYAANWQWMHGEATPWYPLLRSFRQDAPGDWSGPIRSAIAALSQRAVTAVR